MELANAHRPDLILMDVSMPGMDGLTATRQIRRLPDGGDFIIVTIAGSIEPLEATSLAAGADGFVRKPIDPGFTRPLMNLYLQAKLRRINGGNPDIGKEAARHEGNLG